MRSLALACCLLFAGFASAQPAKRFVDASKGSGLRVSENTAVDGTNPHGVGIEDFDGDGLPDVIILTFGKPHIYYFKNLGGLRFRDETAKSGLSNFEGDGTGIAVADFDRDGKLDVYVTSLRKGASRLYRNLGNGAFQDVSEKAGVLSRGPARSCTWADIDLDGWPDLFIARPEGGGLLFRNRGDGTFADVTRDSGIELTGRHSLGCTFADIDGDRLPDLFVTNYQSQPSALFRNLGKGKFKEITEAAGLGRKASSVGCVFADVFNRGKLDLYVSTDSWLSGANYTEAQLLQMKHSVEPNVLYRAADGMKWTEESAATLALKTLGHDISIEDFDHDGLLDIYCGVDAESGNQWATSKGGNPLWSRRDGKAWQNVSAEWGTKIAANCVCVPAVDLDGDGDLDLLLINFYSQPILLRNETNDKNWVQVRANGTGSSRDGIGARVSLFAKGNRDKVLATRHIRSGEGYCRSAPLVAHFGLGKLLPEGYEIEVAFPASGQVVRQAVTPGMRIVVNEGKKAE